MKAIYDRDAHGREGRASRSLEHELDHRYKDRQINPYPYTWHVYPCLGRRAVEEMRSFEEEDRQCLLPVPFQLCGIEC